MRRALLLLSLSVLVASTARAEGNGTQLQVEFGVREAKSDWRGDYATYGTLKFGARFVDFIGVHVLTRLGYGTIDRRLLTFLSVGTQVWLNRGSAWRPYLRIAGFHQHEESMAVVDDNPGGAVFGVGLGIRHRYGGELGAGVDYEMAPRPGRRYSFFGGLELNAGLAGYSSGPGIYAGISVLAGINYAL